MSVAAWEETGGKRGKVTTISKLPLSLINLWEALRTAMNMKMRLLQLYRAPTGQQSTEKQI